MQHGLLLRFRMPNLYAILKRVAPGVTFAWFTPSYATNSAITTTFRARCCSTRLTTRNNRDLTAHCLTLSRTYSAGRQLLA
jgi:hypothetical protein